MTLSFWLANSPFLLLAVVSFSSLIALLIWNNRARQVPGLPMYNDPRSRFFWGGLADVKNHVDDFYGYILSLQMEVGPGVTHTGFGMPGSGPMVRISDPKVVEHVLKTNFFNYVKGERLRMFFGDMLGQGIFNTDGDEWRRTRKTASHMFAMKVMQTDMARVFLEHGHEVINVLRKAADERTIVDLQDLFLRFTMDSICELAFGIKVNTVLLTPGYEEKDGHDGSGVTKLISLSPEQCSRPGPEASSAPPRAIISSMPLSEQAYSFTRSFDNAQSLIMTRFMDPLWRVKRFLGIGKERLLRQHLDVLETFANRIIEKRRDVIMEEIKISSSRARGSGDRPVKAAQDGSDSDVINKHPDLLSRFLLVAHENGEDASDQYLRDLCINFMLAGRDTTAVLLSWFFVEIMSHDDVAQRCLAEFKSVVGEDSSKFSYEHVAQLHYIEAVLLEVLRLHPSVPLDVKTAVSADVLPDGTNIPAGCAVSYSPYIMGRTPMSVWKDRTLEFVPDRFLDEKGCVTCPNAFNFIAFNAGPRTCLGRRMALTEAKIMASLILTNFKCEPLNHPDYPVTTTMHINLMLKKGLMVRIQKK